MKNFEGDAYRKDLAEDLKTIRKVDPEAAKTVLSEEQKTRGYNIARAEKILDHQEEYGPQVERIKGLELSQEVRKLLIEDVAKRYTMETGGKTGEEYKEKLAEENIPVSNRANDLLDKINPSKNRQSVDFISLTPKDFGYIEYNISDKGSRPTMEEIYKRAEELGLVLCLPEDGPEYRLLNRDKEKTIIAMKQVVTLDKDYNGGAPDAGVFFLTNSRGAGLGPINSPIALITKDYAPADRVMDLDTKFLFRLRKKKETN